MQSPAIAVDYLWKGNWGNWEDANQWTLLGVPGSSDSVELAGGASWLSSTRAVGSLKISGGRLWGDGDLTSGSLDFRTGTLGGGGLASTYPTGFTTVTGTALFDGTRSQEVAYQHTLTLKGSSTWTAGGGTINGTPYGGSIINNATFTVLGTGSSAANSSKSLRSPDAAGGGSFVNNGMYLRDGLGVTRAYGFENSGKVQILNGTFQMRDSGSSAGQLQVNKGTELSFYESSATVSGSIINQGLVSFDRSNVFLTNTATLNGDVNILGGIVRNDSINTLNTLSLTGGQITGTGHLTVTNLDFKSGILGGGSLANTYPTGFTTVTGPAVFDGAKGQSVGANHTLTLQGKSTWTAGGGAINGTPYGGAIINNATFTDLGTGSSAANSSKSLRSSSAGGGGSFVNMGSYVRDGLGETRTYGFKNAGLLQIEAGTFAAEEGFSNTGTVQIADKGTLRTSFTNAGHIQGTGRVDTGSINNALVNNGTIDPGTDGGLGSLTITGDFAAGTNGVLHIDLATGGLSDQLIVTDDALWNGELSVWATPGTELHLGDVYTIASFGKRQANSSFSSISWHGLSADQFAVEYTSNNIILRVTAVPEPQSWVLLLAGLGTLGFVARRKAKR
ncbi:PEP-CTERM sorting domain-containing protein [Paucibacter sp. Y2R2-4]|uniref:PEP-CTERM sorting domain-containing protein n=1 Tax=Paucibacter sp. Y2R2-4 TaxID=2893553 RepID=UPI0021E40B18|nr:PEP-CTERM sorting domain-containing protein [Paucibacter sp. Y2R2-4]MCV2348950.1 PEP-CTERM sorting domain-containing protein [Paucibacter sp. Y2R2-4]